MDDETKAHLDGMMIQINSGFDRIPDRLETMHQDVDNARRHMLFGLQESLTLSQRITKIEEELRKQ